ncbi:MAG TPA: hypothetical protein VGM88_04175 [Kofleriaceae bacterium]
MKLTAAGLALLAAHVVALALLISHCHGADLVVHVAMPPASRALAMPDAVDPAVAPRTTVDDPPASPGLHHRRWIARWRGGIERTAGATQLVGPFQDPDALACTGRVVVGQRLLDDGRQRPGTLAREVFHQLDASLHGEEIWPIGTYQRLEELSLRWTEVIHHPEDRALVGDATGYVRGTATVVFGRAKVPLVVAIAPQKYAKGKLAFAVKLRAQVVLDNRVAQWISNHIGADTIATKLAQHQVDDSIASALAPPPPLHLPDGTALRFAYCDGPVEVADGAWGAVPFAFVIERGTDARILPPRAPGTAPRRAPDRDTLLAIDLDLDMLNGILYELWRQGTLDRRLADAGLDRKFDENPTVQQYLTLRLEPPHLLLPPTVAPAAGRLRLSTEAHLAIVDAPLRTQARVWGTVDFAFAGKALAPADLVLGQLELTCERDPETIVPCYGDVVAAAASHNDTIDGALTDEFGKLLAKIFVERRLGGVGVPEIVIHAARPTAEVRGANASIHVELDANLAVHD